MATTYVDVANIRVQFPWDLRTVKSDLNARNAIEPLQRFVGLEVWVVSEAKKYRLVGGIEDANWVDITESASIQTVTVSANDPTGGSNGDIHFKTSAGSIGVYQNVSGTWGLKGTIPTGGSSYTPDPSVPNTGALAYLNSTYPDAKPGDVVYKKASTVVRKWTCYAPGEWSRIDETIET